ncbi:hypothetical protein SCKG_3727 [Saccharomyces cerevisiae]|nr:hypothetical protein SCKG_3727 [Saccharomyces cerevisiae]
MDDISGRQTLPRINRLLEHVGNPQDSLSILHIAGTNGKETVSKFLTSILQHPEQQRQRVLIGRYTTSSLLNAKEEDISINNEAISLIEYSRIEKELIEADRSLKLQCNNLELLTSVALVYFAKKNCQWCIIETGLAGKQDLEFLSQITESSTNKAIFLLDGSNDEFGLQCTHRHMGTLEVRLPYSEEEYQIFNLRVAIAVLDFLSKEKKVCISKDQLSQGLISVDWPRSLHHLDYCYESTSGKKIALLLDNANNAKAARNLACHLRTTYGDTPLTFVIAITTGKKVSPLLDPLIRPQDYVIVTRFGSVVGMPWIQSLEPVNLLAFIKNRYTRNVNMQPDLQSVWTFLETSGLKTIVPVIGLHSEIKKEGANYQKSLEYYLEALEECKAGNMDPLSDEYTGIEIKIGEMYEKLHMYNDATALYGDMLKKFYNELSKTTDKSTKRKFFLLKRDLQILVRFNEINKDSETNATLLIMHLLLAQREFLENSPEFKNVLSKSELLNNQQLDWKNFKGLPFIGKSKPDYQMHLNSKRKQELKIKEPESEQCVFMKELLTARDLYTRYCLNRNNLSGALNSKITTLEWMLLADSPLDDILLAQAELGSIFYLNSEKFEGSLYTIDNEPYKKSEPLELIRSRLQENQNSCLQYSADCYKSIISFANENQYPKVAMESEMDQRILKALSLAHYGIGVINLHKGRLRASKKELKKAIRISEMIRFNELIEEAQRELKKVDGTPI